MSDTTQLDAALEPIREALEADGARLAVAPVVDGELPVEVILRPDACGECVLPPDEMQLMILDLVRDTAPAIRSVAVEVIQPEDPDLPVSGGG